MSGKSVLACKGVCVPLTWNSLTQPFDRRNGFASLRLSSTPGRPSLTPLSAGHLSGAASIAQTHFRKVEWLTIEIGSLLLVSGVRRERMMAATPLQNHCKLMEKSKWRRLSKPLGSQEHSIDFGKQAKSRGRDTASAPLSRARLKMLMTSGCFLPKHFFPTIRPAGQRSWRQNPSRPMRYTQTASPCCLRWLTAIGAAVASLREKSRCGFKHPENVLYWIVKSDSAALNAPRNCSKFAKLRRFARVAEA